MIIVDDISLVIKNKSVLSNIDLELKHGEICGLIGSNGSGKTMLMKCICGFVKPTKGKVVVHDRIIGKDVDYICDAGIIIENPGFIPYYSGFENLKILADVNRKINKEQIINTMRQLGLNPNVRIPVGKYSLGMRQRLGIAQAIMENPSILILDEPMNGLDKDGVKLVRELLLELRKEGKCILLTSHNQDDIRMLCDRKYEMENGSLQEIKD